MAILIGVLFFPIWVLIGRDAWLQRPPGDVLRSVPADSRLVEDTKGWGDIVLRDGPCDYTWRVYWVEPVGIDNAELARRLASTLEGEGFRMRRANPENDREWFGSLGNVSVSIGSFEETAFRKYCKEGSWPAGFSGDRLVRVSVRQVREGFG